MEWRNNRIAQLENQIERIKKEIEIEETWQEQIRQLDSFTDEEKINVFDNLYKQALEYTGEIIETGYGPKDGGHYIFEAVMSECMGRDVWVIISFMQR